MGSAVAPESLPRAAPPVHAVVVAHEPGEWFDETLRSLAAQDYPALTVTVADTGRAVPVADPTEADPSSLAGRVAAVLPEATVIPVAGNPGFAAAANAAIRRIRGDPLGMDQAERERFWLICHDDVVPAPDAVRRLVAEATRRGAAVVGPKLVDWDDPDRLQAVGLSADRLGTPVPLVPAGEYDQGQHDATAEVLAVPSACMLVRAEVFARLGGFDAAMTYHGEDLDFGRRANLSGETVAVVGAAVVRHRARLLQRRPVFDADVLACRHQLRSTLVCADSRQLAAELPLMLLVTFAEAGLALLTGHVRRAGALAGAWPWNLLRVGDIHERRRAVARSAADPGHRAAGHADPARSDPGRAVGRSDPGRAVGLADPSRRDLERTQGLQHRGYVSLARFVARLVSPTQEAGATWGRRRLADVRHDAATRTAVLAWALVLAVFIFGSRHLLTRAVPLVGEMSLLGESPGELFRAWFSTWREAGLGSTGIAPAAYGIAGLAGSLLFGAMGLTRTVLLLGLVPFGAVGLWRLLAPTGSRQAQVVGLVAYVAMPLPYNSLAEGAWSALALYGTLPWICLWLSRVVGPPTAAPPDATGRPTLRFWVPTLAVGMLAGALGAFVPLVAPAVLLLTLALAIGGLLAGEVRLLGRLAGATIAGLALGWLLNWPTAPRTPGQVLHYSGARPDGSSGLDVADMLRFATGTALDSRLVWGLVAAGALALVVARGNRFTWALRAWSLVLGSLVAALAAEHGWGGLNLPRPEVLLAPAAFGLSLAVGLAGAALVADRPARAKRQRLLLAGAGLAVLAIGSVPMLGLTLDGRWGMARGDIATPLATVTEESAGGAFRILWVGHPDVLPLAGWALDDRLVYATSTTGVPRLGLQWPGAESAAAAGLRDAWDAATAGRTDRIGRLLAPYGVRYLIVMERNAPEPFGTVVEPVPEATTQRLAAQFDLERRESRGGVAVYRNTAWRPTRALLEGSAPVTAGGLAGATRLALGDFDPPTTARGSVEADTTLYLADGADGWVLRVGGERVAAEAALGWARSYRLDAAGTAELRHEPSSASRWGVISQLVLWVVLLVSAALVWLRRRARTDRPLAAFAAFKTRRSAPATAPRPARRGGMSANRERG